MWLVVFFDPNNSGENIKSEYIQVAKEVSGKVHCGKSFSMDLAKQWGVTSFPTIMYFQKGQKSDSNPDGYYEGDITAKDIVTWALQKYNGEAIGEYIYHTRTIINPS